MRALPHRAALVLALAVGCQRRAGSSANEEPAASAAPVAAPSVVAPAQVVPAPEVVPLAAPSTSRPAPADECTPGQKVAPATLAATWPARIGSRVRFKSRIEVSVDVMDAVVTAAGHRFVVVAGPDQLWQGEKEHTFTVMGSKNVALGGRTTLPQLLLDPECSP